MKSDKENFINRLLYIFTIPLTFNFGEELSNAKSSHFETDFWIFVPSRGRKNPKVGDGAGSPQVNLHHHRFAS